MMKSHSSFSASSGHLVTRFENAAFNRNRTADAPGARGMPRPAPHRPAAAGPQLGRRAGTPAPRGLPEPLAGPAQPPARHRAWNYNTAGADAGGGRRRPDRAACAGPARPRRRPRAHAGSRRPREPPRFARRRPPSIGPTRGGRSAGGAAGPESLGRAARARARRGERAGGGTWARCSEPRGLRGGWNAGRPWRGAAPNARRSSPPGSARPRTHRSWGLLILCGGREGEAGESRSRCATQAAPGTPTAPGRRERGRPNAGRGRAGRGGSAQALSPAGAPDARRVPAERAGGAGRSRIPITAPVEPGRAHGGGRGRAGTRAQQRQRQRPPLRGVRPPLRALPLSPAFHPHVPRAGHTGKKLAAFPSP